MNIQNQKSFLEELNKKMSENPHQGFEFYKESWPKFDYNERKVLATLITIQVNKMLEVPEFSVEHKLAWVGIIHYTGKGVVDGKIVDLDDDAFPRLTLQDGINGNQITMIFRDLKTKGVITSSYDLIAEAISLIFRIEFDTAYKDLTESKRLQKVQSLLP